MRDRAAERALLCGAFRVDVDPLVVAGGVGELVHLVLGDLDPVAVAEMLAGPGPQAVDPVDDGRHRSTIIAWVVYLNQMRW